jgi:putative adenylate-forming enzyme
MLRPGLLPTFFFHYFRARHPRFPDRAALERWQERRVLRHLRAVSAQSRFYGALARQIPLAYWREWPSMNKAEMLAHFDDIVTAPVTLAQTMAEAHRGWERRDFSEELPGGLTVGLSSGTSGRTGVFLASEQERAAWAGSVLGRALPRGLFSRGGTQRIAFFLRANSTLYEATRSRRVQFEFFDLLAPWPEHFSRLRALRPTVLVAPPSALRMIAEAQASGKLSLPNPERIISVAEVLEPTERAAVGRVFPQTIHQVYQATEGFIAATCRHGVLHLNEDALIVEKRWLHEPSGRFVPILTDLYRFTQPIVRYELNDVLIARRSPCPCGSIFQALDSIEGRTDDLCDLLLPDGSRGQIFPDYLRLAVTTSDDRIDDFFIRNPCPGELDISLDATALSPAEKLVVQTRVRTRLLAVCVEGGFATPAIRFVPPPKAIPGAKLRRVSR